MNTVKRYCVEATGLGLHLEGHAVGTIERVVVQASDFDTALAREAALREELETSNRALHNAKVALKAASEMRELWKGRTTSLTQANAALQHRLTVAEQCNESITGKVSSCKDCGSSDLFWFAQNTVPNGIQQNRLNTHDVQCVFFLGCNHCSATLKQVSADSIAEKITAALKPAAEGEGS